MLLLKRPLQLCSKKPVFAAYWLVVVPWSRAGRKELEEHSLGMNLLGRYIDSCNHRFGPLVQQL
jgi:hypothetical protein